MVRRQIRGPRRFDEHSSADRPNLRAELDYLAPRFGSAVQAAAAAYRRLGVRYALIGGVAAGAYGRPRTTKDVDFLVGDEAFDSIGVVISFKAGIPQEACEIPIDNVPLHTEYRDLYERALDGAIDSDVPGVLIARPEMVAVTKLAGGRLQDVVAVVEMLRSGAVSPDELGQLVQPHEQLRRTYERALAEWSGGAE